MSVTSPAPAGKSLFESRTVWSILAAAFFAYLPSLLTTLGVPLAQQGAVLDALHQLGTPLALVAGIIFHAISTRPVTSILPSKAPPVPPAAVAIVAVFLLAGSVLGLPGCKSVPVTPASTEVIVAQGDTTLDASYNVAAKLYLGALGQMPPALHDQLKADLVKAYALVHAVDDGVVIGTEGTLTQEIADATALIAEVKRLAPAPASK